MDGEGVVDVYRPLQFDQPEDGSQLPAVPEAENAGLGSTLMPCDGGELQELIPSPTHQVVVETLADRAMDVEMAVMVEDGGVSGRNRSGSAKRKRGRKGGRTPVKTKKGLQEEDVCFICFDGGNLVLCDRKMCPKAYHPTCVNRDEAFFRKKGRWNCGWHLCSVCEKAAHFLCYTCTYSLCKGCIKESDFLCVQPNSGLCVNCMKLVILIENKDTNKDNVTVDFDDKSSWEYLFKEYWQDVKRKLSLDRTEIINASNPWKGAGAPTPVASSNELHNANNELNYGSDNSKGPLEMGKSAPKRQKKRSRTDAADKVLPSITRVISGEGASELTESEQWASKELLDFVGHMKSDKSALSVFEVQSLLMDYVTKYKLRDPRKKSQIICDARLQNLFGKARVGHFEMLKLIESHILIKDTSSEVPKIQGGNADDDVTQVEHEGSTIAKTGSDRKRKMKKKGDETTPQASLNDYAAVDAHNINLIYLRRNLVEDLLDDMEKFQDKVVGSFVRIRISGSGNKQDMYRLVQVVGTSRAAKEYKTGKKSTDIMMEILNLNKTETITTDSISNQEFSEEECKRLRQSIKCGFIRRLTVGEIQEKAKSLQHVKVNDWFETEILRLGHLRDRASEKGRRKELRECVEKLQVLNDPDERARRLQEVPEVHVDPNMDPNYESEEKEDVDDQKREHYARPRDIGYFKRGREALSPGKGVIVDGLDGSQKNSHSPWERIKNSFGLGEPRKEKGQYGIGDKAWNQSKSSYAHHGEQNNDRANKTWSQGADKLSSGVLPEIPLASQAAAVTTSANISETEKTWYYRDPSGKIQGPFSMVQLRKWSTTGYFPSDLRVWRNSEKQDDGTLLIDALAGKFHQESTQSDLQGGYANAHKGSEAGNWDSSRDWNHSGPNRSTWADSTQRGGNSSWKEASGFVSGSAEIQRKDGLGAQSTGWASSSVESFEPSWGHVTSVSCDRDLSRGSTPWSSQSLGHSPRLPSSYVDNSYRAPVQRTTDAQVGFLGARLDQSERHTSTWSPSQSVDVQTSGTWNAGHGYDKHLASLASSTQSLKDGEKVHTEKVSSMESIEASSLASATSVAGRHGDTVSSGNDRSDLAIPTPIPAGAEWLQDQTSENKTLAPQAFVEPVSHVNKLGQQSCATSTQMENQISESKASASQVSVGSMRHVNYLEQPSAMATQSKDQTSGNETSALQVSDVLMSTVSGELKSSDTAIQSVDQTSENRLAVPQVSAEPTSPVSDLEQRSPITTQSTIIPTATDGQLPTSGITSVMEHDCAMTLDSTQMRGVWSAGQNSGVISCGSSPEPSMGVVLDTDKYPKIVPAVSHPVSAAGLGASTHGLLPSVGADGLPRVIHNDGQDSGQSDSFSGTGSDSIRKLHADGGVRWVSQELDHHTAVISSDTPCRTHGDLTVVHVGAGSAGSLAEPVETRDAFLADENPESSQLVIITAEISTVDEIWDGLLDADGGQPVSDFFPEDLDTDKVQDSGTSSPICGSPSQAEDSQGTLPESLLRSSSHPVGWVSDSGFGSNTGGCGGSAATLPMSQGSEMIPQPFSDISTNKGERSCLASENQESSQKPADADLSQVNISGDGWLPPQASPEVSEVIQSANPMRISHPYPEHDQDAGASVVTTNAAGSVSVTSSNTADQGVRDVSLAPDSSPLLVSAGELTPLTSGSGDVPLTVPDSQAFNSLRGDFSVSAAEEQAPATSGVGDIAITASNSQVSDVFSGDFSVSTAAEKVPASSSWDAISNKVQNPLAPMPSDFSVSATAAAPIASSDTWSTPTSTNSSNISPIPPPAMAGNASSGVANLYLGKSSNRSTASEGWGSPTKNLATPTDKQGIPSSHSTWRPGGGSEASIPRRSGWCQPTESSRTGWNQQPGNTNARWGVESGNQRGGWEQQRREGDRYSGYGDRGGYGGQGHGGRSWSKPPGGGGGGGGGGGSSGGARPPRSQKVCKFYESGYCKKGASCDFLHP